MSRKDLNKAEFILDNGNVVTYYHGADVLNMITEYEEACKAGHHFFIGNWDQVEELYYNGERLDSTNYSIPTAKVHLHKFEG